MNAYHVLRSLSVLLLIVRVFAQAPDSLAGKILNEHFSSISSRGLYATITQFNSDVTYSFIRVSGGSRISGLAFNMVFIQTPPAGGTWSYTRTGPSAGQLLINPPPGTSGASDIYFARTLTFTSSTSGSLTATGAPGAAAGYFTLTDAATAAAAPLSNVSLRGRVEPGRPLIAGFVVPGTERRDLLIRVVGPSLSQFGLTETWVDPDFSVVPANPDTSSHIDDAYYTDWSAPSRQSSDLNAPALNPTNPAGGFKKIFAYVGAFPLFDVSKDAAQVINLGPGSYSVVCLAPGGDPGGEALIEIYFLP